MVEELERKWNGGVKEIERGGGGGTVAQKGGKGEMDGTGVRERWNRLYKGDGYGDRGWYRDRGVTTGGKGRGRGGEAGG